MFSTFREGREKRREEQEKQRKEQKKQRLEDERTKWLTTPIEQDYSLRHPHPSFEELADRAIHRAGSGVEFDHDAVVAYVYNFWLTLTIGIVSRDSVISNAVSGLWTIPQRDDFEYRMLWDFLTMQGPWGQGIYEFLAKDIQSEEIIGLVAGRIRRGDLCYVDKVYRLAGEDVEDVYHLSSK